MSIAENYVRKTFAARRDELPDIDDDLFEDALDRFLVTLRRQQRGQVAGTLLPLKTVRKVLWNAVEDSDPFHACRRIIDLCFPQSFGILSGRLSAQLGLSLLSEPMPPNYDDETRMKLITNAASSETLVDDGVWDEKRKEDAMEFANMQVTGQSPASDIVPSEDITSFDKVQKRCQSPVADAVASSAVPLTIPLASSDDPVVVALQAEIQNLKRMLAERPLEDEVAEQDWSMAEQEWSTTHELASALENVAAPTKSESDEREPGRRTKGVRNADGNLSPSRPSIPFHCLRRDSLPITSNGVAGGEAGTDETSTVFVFNVDRWR
ncbi:hypothetical protein HK101_000483 [Irineochytrium annulatum]|nr:hypothetical protein HK101_000483 [Irineochytrium annulatum]